MTTEPITNRILKGGRKTGSKHLDSGKVMEVAPDGNYPIKTFSRSKLFNNAPKSPLSK